MTKKAGAKGKGGNPNDQKGNDKSTEKSKKENTEKEQEKQVCQMHESSPVVCTFCNKTMSGNHSNHSSP